MTLSPAFLDELRARTLLSAVIGPSVKLIKAGREFKACCPFHQEKTPSFTVNDEKGFYHCFGCGAHGDAIRFLTDQRGLPFIDAVKELAGKAGMEVPASDPRSKERADASAGLYDVMAAAQRWFAEQLQGSEGGAAREYLAKRGIDALTIERFGLGLAPNARTRLRAALASHGEDKLVETGMLIKPDANESGGGGETYDRFRGRLMIPIRDARGRVIAFGGRILGDGEPKYLNSPETPLFDKGRTLYNIDRASPASRSSRRVIVVEGYMDVIALDKAGISETVAPLGTALTEGQLERLWRLDPAPLLCFDGDAAGQKAAVRAALRALPHVGLERTLRFVSMPAGQDPDDVIQAGGVALFQKLLSKPTNFSDLLWQRELQQNDTNTPEGRANLRYRLSELADSISDRNFREEYRREFQGKFFENFGFKRQDIKKLLKVISETSSLGRQKGVALIQRAVLLGLTRYPEVASANLELVAELQFSHRKLAIWRDILLDAVIARPDLDEDALQTILDSSEASPIEKRDIRRDLAFSFFRRMADKIHAQRDLLHVMTVLVSEAKIGAELKDASERYQRTLEDAAWEQQNALHQRRHELMEEMAELRAALAA